MPKLTNNTSNISLTKNDILNLSRIKEDYVTIEEYNEFACQARNKIKILMTNLLKIQHVANVNKIEILQSMSNGSTEFNTAQYALSQVELGLYQINQKISYLQEANKSLNYIDKKIEERKQKEITKTKSEQINDTKKFNHGTIKTHQSPNIESNNKNQANLSCQNQLNEEKINYNNVDKPSTVDLDQKDDDKETKEEKNDIPNQNNNPVNKNHDNKVKPKLGVNKSNIFNKFHKKVTVAVINTPILQTVVQKFKETKIKANSHESDFSPTYHVNKNYTNYKYSLNNN